MANNIKQTTVNATTKCMDDRENGGQAPNRATVIADMQDNLGCLVDMLRYLSIPLEKDQERIGLSWILDGIADKLSENTELLGGIGEELIQLQNNLTRARRELADLKMA